MKKLIPFLILLSCCLAGCRKSDSDSIMDREELPLKIKAGFMCGWGAGEDLNQGQKLIPLTGFKIYLRNFDLISTDDS